MRVALDVHLQVLEYVRDLAEHERGVEHGQGDLQLLRVAAAHVPDEDRREDLEAVVHEDGDPEHSDHACEGEIFLIFFYWLNHDDDVIITRDHAC